MMSAIRHSLEGGNPEDAGCWLTHVSVGYRFWIPDYSELTVVKSVPSRFSPFESLKLGLVPGSRATPVVLTFTETTECFDVLRRNGR